jgi:hypothetical protein
MTILDSAGASNGVVTMPRTILELPFRERRLHDVLHLDGKRVAPDRDYAGYGWARADAIWLDELRVRDALVLALHSADDAEPLTDDIELEFELAGHAPVSVLASMFLAKWLPQLPRASAIVLAVCNPHRATLHVPAPAPLYYAHGDVESWLDEGDAGTRIRLAAQHGWIRRDA